MDPITPDDAKHRADALSESIKKRTATITKIDSQGDAERAERAKEIDELRGLQNVKGISKRDLGYIRGALTECTPPHLRNKKETTK